MSKVLVITGGIGSGKSEVCRILGRMGYTAQYDADSRVKMLYDESEGLLEAIEERLGCTLRDERGEFRPSLLAERIFSDRNALETVESLVFPRLIEDFRQFVARSEESEGFKGVVILESATILQKKAFDGLYDAVIFVDAPFETRLGRACSRDSVHRDRVLERMRNQTLANAISDFRSGSNNHYEAPEPDILSRIDAFIDNDCSLDELYIRVENVVNDIITKKFLV
ncbi:MAG: dephospho-CoA kinase [Candidatus Cryptobacteroides sp.]